MLDLNLLLSFSFHVGGLEATEESPRGDHDGVVELLGLARVDGEDADGLLQALVAAIVDADDALVPGSGQRIA